MEEELIISVIIPVLNEEELLPFTLESLEANTVEKEIIIVDAGSTDKTLEKAAGEGRKVLSSPIPQRAAQMNLGASHARGEILFFLHGDTLAPAPALLQMKRAMADPAVVGGGFSRRYDHPSRFLGLTCLMANSRSRLWGWYLGDQGIFTRKKVFHRLHGFPAWNQFEDLEFSRRLKREGRLAHLKVPLLSSGRRFGANPARKTLKDLLLTLKYLRGNLKD